MGKCNFVVVVVVSIFSLVYGSSGVAVEQCESSTSDPDGDGWGWENNSSCRVAGQEMLVPIPSDQASVCLSSTSDPDGDSWGWENGTSCRVDTQAMASPSPSDQPPACLLSTSDPDGDGWGWENGTSCQAGVQTTDSSLPSDQSSVCVSSTSDPDGDGWGWENGASCRVDTRTTGSPLPLDQPPVCLLSTSDPDGDGWGWENGSSCTVGSVENTSSLVDCSVLGADPMAADWNEQHRGACRSTIVQTGFNHGTQMNEYTIDVASVVQLGTVLQGQLRGSAADDARHLYAVDIDNPEHAYVFSFHLDTESSANAIVSLSRREGSTSQYRTVSRVFNRSLSLSSNFGPAEVLMCLPVAPITLEVTSESPVNYSLSLSQTDIQCATEIAETDLHDESIIGFEPIPGGHAYVTRRELQVSTHDGQELWSLPLPINPEMSDIPPYNAMYVIDDMIYVVEEELQRRRYSVSAVTQEGLVSWIYNSDGEVENIIDAGDDGLYLVTSAPIAQDLQIIAIDANGREQWISDPIEIASVDTGTFLAPGNSLYVFTLGGDLLRVEPVQPSAKLTYCEGEFGVTQCSGRDDISNLELVGADKFSDSTVTLGSVISGVPIAGRFTEVDESHRYMLTQEHPAPVRLTDMKVSTDTFDRVLILGSSGEILMSQDQGRFVSDRRCLPAGDYFLQIEASRFSELPTSSYEFTLDTLDIPCSFSEIVASNINRVHSAATDQGVVYSDGDTLGLISFEGNKQWSLHLPDFDIGSLEKLSFHKNTIVIADRNSLIAVSLLGNVLWQYESMPGQAIIYVSQTDAFGQNTVVVGGRKFLTAISADGGALWNYDYEPGYGQISEFIIPDSTGIYLSLFYDDITAGLLKLNTNGQAEWFSYHRRDPDAELGYKFGDSRSIYVVFERGYLSLVGP